QNICRDGVTRMALTEQALRVRFSTAADMRRGDTDADRFGSVIHELVVRFPAGARWVRRLDAALGRLCALVSSYQHTPFDGSAGFVVFRPPRISRAWRRREQRKQQLLQAARAGDLARVAALLARS